jgi:hypothetical protein
MSRTGARGRAICEKHACALSATGTRMRHRQSRRIISKKSLDYIFNISYFWFSYIAGKFKRTYPGPHKEQCTLVRRASGV